MLKCAVCHKDLEVVDKVFRRDECPHCGNDLHSCVQCSFYSPGHHNDCRESQADMVADKERANFCDYFELGREVSDSNIEDVKTKLDKLFKL